MVGQKLVRILEDAVIRAQREEKLPPVALSEISVEHPQSVAHGDYATSLPLKLARITGLDPLKIAQTIVELTPLTPEVDRIEVAPPGFINFTLKNDWLAQQVECILDAGEGYGDIDLGEGTRVQVEFVSVNPTGPLHIGHGRGAVLGSTLANVLTSAGYLVEKEYYINDAGTQIDVFCRSLYARYQQAFGIPTDVPSDGYHGDYVVELAREIIAEEGDSFLALPPDEATSRLGKIGLRKMIEAIKADLEMIRVNFDVWFSEQSLYDEGQYQKVMERLKRGGHILEREGAVWFVSSGLGEDKDNVLVRGNGTPTYFASDCAYHYNKFLERHFDRAINIWGADHQGHVSRMKVMVGALGIDPERLHIILTQMVSLRRGGQEVRISKRSGDIITLREVVEEVGADACRFSLLSHSTDSQMDFDLERAKSQSMDNPVYYVQYAHARIASILRLAKEKNIDYSAGDVSLLTTEPEVTLIRRMLQLPEVIETVACTLEPHHLPYYARELATAFHSFYKQCRVVSQDYKLTCARLKLVEAAKLVLTKSLHLMGITAPEQM
jgi:arginyl-tRNA synthetase